MLDKLRKYLKEETIVDIFNRYDTIFIKNVCTHNSIDDVVNVLKKYDINFLDELFYYYFEIIDVDPLKIDKALDKIKTEHQSDYLDIIENDILILKKMIEND